MAGINPRIKFNLTKDTVKDMVESEDNVIEMKENPNRLRKRMLQDNIEFFTKNNPSYANIDYKELMKLIRTIDIKKEKELGDSLVDYCMTIDLLKTFEGAQEFYVSKKTMDDIMEDLSDCGDYANKADFKKMRIPFENMLITFEGVSIGYTKYCLQCFKLDDAQYNDNGIKKDIYTVKIFMGVSHVTDAYFVIDKLPRIFIFCNKLESCDYGVKSSLFGGLRDCCLKSPRTAMNCSSNNGGDDVTLASLTLRSVFIVFEIMMRFYKKPSFVYRTMKNIKGEKGDTLENINKRKESNIIRLTDKRYIYESYESIERKRIERGSPCEHLRKEHERRLKDGRVIKIKESTINKGKGRKVIKV